MTEFQTSEVDTLPTQINLAQQWVKTEALLSQAGTNEIGFHGSITYLVQSMEENVNSIAVCVGV